MGDARTAFFSLPLDGGWIATRSNGVGVTPPARPALYATGERAAVGST